MHKAVIHGVARIGAGRAALQALRQGGAARGRGGTYAASLDAVVATSKIGGEASSFVSDATKEADVAALFEHAGSDVDVAIYNAGNNTSRSRSRNGSGLLREKLAGRCYGGFLFGRRPCVAWSRGSEAPSCSPGRAPRCAVGRVRRLQFSQGPACVPWPGDGEGIRPRGIHVGHVVVDGAVDGERYANASRR